MCSINHTPHFASVCGDKMMIHSVTESPTYAPFSSSPFSLVEDSIICCVHRSEIPDKIIGVGTLEAFTTGKRIRGKRVM